MGKYLRADLRYANWWVGIVAAALFLVLLGCLTTFESGPPWPARWDKTLHALSYMILMVLCCGLYAKKARVPIMISLFLFGAIIELIQLYASGRGAEWADLLANFIGLTVGFIIARFWLGDWCLRLEKFLRLQ
jgi:VanZ family protein